MADLDAAIGYVVAHGDSVDRARLSYLRSGSVPGLDVLEKAEFGDLPAGGWPALSSSAISSVDAPCLRLAPLAWLPRCQYPGGYWQEPESLAAGAPPWAQPGDPESTVYLTVHAAYWLA